ncbi:hypothetical protein OQZ33_18285, partial [Pedobacter sp. MC2016-05]|uniref:hypothetical protein n=1 Tax=Pedobacter sp. MC2016-05 TaxID=2994474 RepID=UPI0022470D60
IPLRISGLASDSRVFLQLTFLSKFSMRRIVVSSLNSVTKDLATNVHNGFLNSLIHRIILFTSINWG